MELNNIKKANEALKHINSAREILEYLLENDYDCDVLNDEVWALTDIALTIKSLIIKETK